jgi:hypothetical protein
MLVILTCFVCLFGVPVEAKRPAAGGGRVHRISILVHSNKAAPNNNI